MKCVHAQIRQAAENLRVSSCLREESFRQDPNCYPAKGKWALISTRLQQIDIEQSDLRERSSGHRAPMHHLDKFIAYMKSKPGVWFATGEQIARYLK
jgi:hypothetical protein